MPRQQQQPDPKLKASLGEHPITWGDIAAQSMQQPLYKAFQTFHPHLLIDARLDTKPQQEACSQKYPINSRRKRTMNLLVQFIKPFSTELIGSEIDTKLISRLRMMIGSPHGQGGLEFLCEISLIDGISS